ncbi:hypothetical protein V8E36_003403 [Tilletia maclaganii]
MSQFPKSGFLARAATSSAAARASLRSKSNHSSTSSASVSSSSSSRRTSHSHPSLSPASSASSSTATVNAAIVTSASGSAPIAIRSASAAGSALGRNIGESSTAHHSESFEPESAYPPLPVGGALQQSPHIPTSSTPFATSLPTSSSSPTFSSIGVHVATSSSNVFGPSASLASAITTVAPSARRPFNFWPQAVVTTNSSASSLSGPSSTATGYAAAVAAHAQTVTSPILGGSASSHPVPTSTPQPTAQSRPSPADIFLSSLNSDFDPSSPWTSGTPAVDWLSNSFASSSIQATVSWEGRVPSLPAPRELEVRSPVLKRSRAASATHNATPQWRRPEPISFDTTAAQGENWSASFSSNFYRSSADPSLADGSSGSQARSASRKHSSGTSSSSSNQQGYQHHHQHQQGRSPPPQPNTYTSSNNSTVNSSGALIARPPSSGSSSSGSSSLPASSTLSNAAAAATASSSSSTPGSTPLNGNGFGAPGGVSARAFSIPPHSHSFAGSMEPQFHFEHGAYGIPKRHPLSSMQRKRRKAGSADAAGGKTGAGSSGVGGAAAGFFAAAASTLVGSTGLGSSSTSSASGAKEESKAADQKESAVAPTPNFTNATSTEVKVANGAEPNSASANTSTDKKEGASDSPSPQPQPPTERPRPRGIRQDGRIVHERLRSVPVGEDAYFLREDALGVADGVGGWASRPGADPALFSRLLMHFCSVELSRFDALSSEQLAANDGSMLRRWAHVDPVEIIHCAWHRCVRAARREGIIGSSTALVAVLRGDELRIANVGDCVLLIIRQGDLLFRSTEQQHSFNFPVQLGMMGDTVESVAEELQKRKVAAEAKKAEAEARAAAVAAVAVEAEAAAKGDETPAVAEEEDGDDEPVPDGVDYTIAGHPTSTSDETGNTIAEGAAAATEAQLANGKTTDPANDSNNSRSRNYAASPEHGDADDDAEVEWDEPRRDAGRWSVKVEPGDVIIIGSDGLVDNLFDEDILEEVLRFAPAPAAPTTAAGAAGEADPGGKQVGEDGTGEDAHGAHLEHAPFGHWLPADFSPQLVSEALCSRAKAVSEDSRALYSPFQQRAVTEGLHYVGGKLDDISVLVAVVGAHNVGTDQEGKLFVSSQSLGSYQSQPPAGERDASA